MLRERQGPRPGRGGGGDGLRPWAGAQLHLSTSQLPLAIAWRKGGRDIVLGKLLELDGRLALATAYRWRVLPEAVSLPDVAIRVLLRLGARDWVVRDDLRHRAWLVGLRQLIQAPLKGGERYARLADADPAPWRWWPFAQQVVDLLELAEALEEGRQLPLLEEVRP